MQQHRESTRIASDMRGRSDRWRGWIPGFVAAAGERIELRFARGVGRVAPAAVPAWPTRLPGMRFGPPTSEVAECTCLDDCPRDHEND
jgi:hypothetical protein